MRRFAAMISCVLIFCASPLQAESVIFFHPDGVGVNSWQALRFKLRGERELLNWDKLPHMGIYVGTMKDSAVSTSHGGATSHAYGKKVAADSFGLDGHEPLISASGFDGSIMHEAMEHDYKTVLINSGSIIEPGTAAFVAKAEERSHYEDIAKQVIHSGVDIILSGGEKYLLPQGEQGQHGSGIRRDGVNLIREAESLGYHVVYNAEELADALNKKPSKLLGVFAQDHMFNAIPEALLNERHMPHYIEGTPSVAQMTDAAIQLMKGQRFFMVIEEEGIDNFLNAGNPYGGLVALARADEALGVMLEHQREAGDLMILTASDSDAGGMQVTKADALGKHYHIKDSAASVPYEVKTLGRHDYAGGILVRSTSPLPPIVNNTDIFSLMHEAMGL